MHLTATRPTQPGRHYHRGSARRWQREHAHHARAGRTTDGDLLYNPQVARTTQNLAAFATVNAWINTIYPGKIEIGLSTLDVDGNGQEAFVQIGNGEYGLLQHRRMVPGVDSAECVQGEESQSWTSGWW